MIKKIGFVVLVVLGVFAYDFFLKPPSFGAGEFAPDFSAQLIDGTPVKLSDFQGKYVLLDFWGSWCGPCRKEIPDLKRFYASFHAKNYIDADDFVILSVALEKSDKLTKQIIQTEGLNWPTHVIDVQRIVMMSPIAQKFDVKELPTKFLISPKGQIIGTNMSFEEMGKQLTAKFQ